MNLVSRLHRLGTVIVGATLLAVSASAQYAAASAVGPFPVPPSGTGGNSGQVWATPILPTGVDVARVPLAGAGVPVGALDVRSVTIYGLSHTWIGDLYLWLESPGGAKYTLVARPGFTGTGFGSGNNVLNADITIVDPLTAGALPVPTTSDWTAGTYQQYFNANWNSAAQLAAISNTAMSAIAIAPGVWTLAISDWAGGDLGQFDHWEMSGDAQPPIPVAYCTAGTSTNGCVPSISATDQPSIGFSNPCVITVTNVEGQRSGIVFYGINNTGFIPAPWAATSTSVLCVKGPTQHMNARASGGTSGACDGNLVQNWNSFQMASPTALGNPFSVGQMVFAQGWYRDPSAVKTTNLSNALELTCKL